jgi:hypothetical protein
MRPVVVKASIGMPVIGLSLFALCDSAYTGTSRPVRQRLEAEANVHRTITVEYHSPKRQRLCLSRHRSYEDVNAAREY